MKTNGVFKIYFIAPEAFPIVWCIAALDHSWEMAVKSYELVGVRAVSCYDATSPKQAEHEYEKPRAWMEVSGELTVTDGNAVIREYASSFDNSDMFRAWDFLAARIIESPVHDADQWRWFRNRLEAFAYSPTLQTYGALQDAMHKLWTTYAGAANYDKPRWIALSNAIDTARRYARSS